MDAMRDTRWARMVVIALDAMLVHRMARMTLTRWDCVLGPRLSRNAYKRMLRNERPCWEGIAC